MFLKAFKNDGDTSSLGLVVFKTDKKKLKRDEDEALS